MPKIGTMEVHHTGNSIYREPIRGQKDKMKVTRAINAVRDNAAYGSERRNSRDTKVKD